MPAVFAPMPPAGSAGPAPGPRGLEANCPWPAPFPPPAPPTTGPPSSCAESLRTCMGSLTSRGPAASRPSETGGVVFGAFRRPRRPDLFLFAAQYPARTFPYQRLPDALAAVPPRLGVSLGSLLPYRMALSSTPLRQLLAHPKHGTPAILQYGNGKTLWAMSYALTGIPEASASIHLI